MKTLLFLSLITFVASEIISIQKGNFSVRGTDRSTEQCGCGYTKYGTSACDGSTSRIIGGRSARDQEYPWQALIRICNSDGCSICGGTLLNYFYVLTAAHCLKSNGEVVSISGITVVLGAKMLNSNNPYRRSYSVDTVIIHGEYDETQVKNDIALIKLTTEVEMNEGTTPACLPSSESVTYEDKKVVVSGWGQFSLSSPDLSQILKRTGLTVLKNSHQYCINGGGFRRVPVDTKLCAYRENTDSCAGDSGGPLVVPEDGRCTVVGIVSYGIGCANQFHAGVYTRVSRFLFWIRYLSRSGGCMEALSPRKCDLTCTNVRTLTGNIKLNGIEASCTAGICYAFRTGVNLCIRLNAPCNQRLSCPYANQCDLRQILTNVYGNPDLPPLYSTTILGIPVQCNTRTGDCCSTEHPESNLCQLLNQASGGSVFSRKIKD